MLRARVGFVAAALATIAAGVFVHWRGEVLGAIARDMVGDMLWAAMMAWWVGALAPNARLVARSAGALSVCVAVELSQLYHEPVLDAFRQTRVGHLLLGSGFDPRDLAAYALGVTGAILVEVAVGSVCRASSGATAANSSSRH
jgi:hypothetical protein